MKLATIKPNELAIVKNDTLIPTGNVLPAGSTMIDLIAGYDGLKGRLLTPEGGLHRFVNIYVNDEDVRFLGALDAKVADGDSVTILPAVAGGALGFAAVAALLGR